MMVMTTTRTTTRTANLPIELTQQVSELTRPFHSFIHSFIHFLSSSDVPQSVITQQQPQEPMIVDDHNHPSPPAVNELPEFAGDDNPIEVEEPPPAIIDLQQPAVTDERIARILDDIARGVAAADAEFGKTLNVNSLNSILILFFNPAGNDSIDFADAEVPQQQQQQAIIDFAGIEVPQQQQQQVTIDQQLIIDQIRRNHELDSDGKQVEVSLVQLVLILFHFNRRLLSIAWWHQIVTHHHRGCRCFASPRFRPTSCR